MSFATDVKEELTRFIPIDKNVKAKELAALFTFGTTEYVDNLETVRFRYLTEAISITKKVMLLLEEVFDFKTDFFVRRHHLTTFYGIEITGRRTIKNLFNLLGIRNSTKTGSEDLAAKLSYRGEFNNEAEEAAFIRGAFLIMGSMTNPLKAYHFELNASDESSAILLKEILCKISSEANITRRKGFFPVYIKDGSVISDLLIVLGASKAMLDFENARVVRETRGNVNRRVNCEVSNIKKAANAGLKQIEAINLIIAEGRLNALPETLKEMAKLRLENPEASLSELGEICDPPLGRSGVNHRLQRLVEYAEGIKQH